MASFGWHEVKKLHHHFKNCKESSQRLQEQCDKKNHNNILFSQIANESKV